MKTLKFVLVTALGLTTALAVNADDAKQIYALDSSTSGGVDLTAMPGYYADRMYGPVTDNITFSGPLTVDSSVSAENPFVLLGRGKKITVDAEGSGFHSTPLKLCNAEGVKTTSTLTFSKGNFTFPSLDVGKYNKFTKAYYGSGNQSFSTSKVTIHDGGSVENYGYKMGLDVTNFEMSVVSGGIFKGSYLYVGNQSQSLGEGVYPSASLYVSNATVEVTGTTTKFTDGKSLALMFSCDAADNKTKCCQVTIAKEGLIKAQTIIASGSQSEIVFDGGRFTSSSETQSIPLFYLHGLKYTGKGWTSPSVHMHGTNGCPIDIEIPYDRILADGSSGSERNIHMFGSDGFTKRGVGILDMNKCNSSTCTYTGPTTILGGGLRVMDADFQPGRGGLNVSEGCFLDMNGFDCSFATAEGMGVVTNGAETASTLTLGCANTTGVFELATVGGPVNVSKTGAGTLTVSGAALTNTGDLTVAAGTVVIADDCTSYGTVTVEAGATLDLRGIAFSCGQLLNKGSVLTDVNTHLALGGDTDQTFNNGLVGQTGDFIKQGAGTLSLFGAQTINGLVDVTAGTLKVQPGIWAGKYIKLNMQKGQSSDSKQWHKRLGTFALYDANGIDVARSVTVQNPTSGATGADLAEGEVRFGNTGFYEIPEGEGVLNLFDGDNTTLFDLQSGWGNEFIILRLPNAAGNLVGYNFNNGQPAFRLVTWNLYGSENGSDWTLLGCHSVTNWDDMADRQRATDETPDTKAAWYNGGVPYCFASLSNATGRAFGISAMVRVAEGATLDFSSVGMELGGLLIDCAAGAGTILRFTPADDGVIELMNADLSQLMAGYVLPMTFGEIAQPSRLKTWHVKVNGKLNDGFRVRQNADGQVVVAPKTGLMIFVY